MATCRRNDVGSLILDRTTVAPATSGGHFRKWPGFSGAAFRRKIFDAVSCGGSSRYRHHNRGEDYDDNSNAPVAAPAVKEKAPAEKPKTTAASKANGKSEKLMDLLNLAEWSESEAEAAATRRKVEVLERLKRVVRDLQVEETGKRREAATEARLLAKEDLEARWTLAMLGAIPPLVGMLDFEDHDSQIAALYALLNLGIGNDM